MAKLPAVRSALLFLACIMSCTRAQSVYKAQPKIQTQNGNLILVSAENKNISLRTVGSQSYINFNGENLILLVNMAKNASQLVEGLRNGELADLQLSIQSLHQAGRTVQRRLTQVENLVANGTAMFRLQRTVRRMKLSLGRNECASNPCNNGGTCEDAYNNFICRCPPNWEGDTCSIDVNECARFAGTDQGCQYGATCINRQGSYDCLCPDDRYGLHCTLKNNDCERSSSQELCGHGICISQRIGGRTFMCLCDQGWSMDATTGACTVDVDECSASKVAPACSRSPPVPCINTPGSFVCGACPQGYSGNGYYCNDVNECLSNNGGCSISPLVQCLNTQGSRSCGACPVGYEGDGVTCTYRGLCRMNNGGCHPIASCYENPNVGQNYVQCTCPNGYVGSGIGPNGCVLSAGAVMPNISMVHTNCYPNPCVHGNCITRGNTFTCSCFPGYIGSLCQAALRPCDPNPCLNGGTCFEQNGGSYSCVCSQGYKGQRCESQESSCGGHIRNESGVLTYPTDGTFTSNRNANCVWLIRTNASKVIHLNFTAFDIMSSPNCRGNWLQVHDGPQSYSRLVGTYCGTTLPPNIVSTYGALVIWYHITNTAQRSSFSIEWQTKDPVCGSSVTNVHGNIASPGSPGQYPKNRDCQWMITVTPGTRVQMHIFLLMLQNNTDCNHDFLKIYNGILPTDPVLRLFCNTSQPAPFISSGHEVLVHFHSDNEGTDYGFQMTYSEIAGEPGCGGVWTSSSGELTSPNFPQLYPGKVYCEYLIQLPIADKIQLSFVTFELEHAVACSFDYIEIREGSRRTDPLVGRFCGTNIPAPYISQGNELLILFHSDISISAKGFKAKYTTACGGLFTANSGSLSSPNYPAHYPPFLECIYTIATPLKTIIELDFQDFNIERHAMCAYDSLEIRDGDNENSPLIGVYCGFSENKPPRLLSTFNHVWLKFTSDLDNQHNGFLANYSIIPTACGGILRNLSGSFDSGSLSIGNSRTCTWVISVPATHVIQLTWQQFHSSFIFDAHCNESSVTVYDNSTAARGGELMGKYCKDERPPVMTTLGNVMTIIAVRPYQLPTFTVSYTAIPSDQLCGITYRMTNGVLQSPGYPHDYSNNIDCTWIIELPPGRQLRLNITSFQLEDSTNCTFDWLEIRNGGNSQSPLIGKFCGQTIPKIIPSFSNAIFVHLKTDMSVSSGGFSIEWDGTATGCGGIITGSSGSIASPNYPNNYPKPIECFWKIVGNRGSSIRIQIFEIEINDLTCNSDYLEFRDGPSYVSPLMGRLCRSTNILQLNSSQNVVLIKFRSDASGMAGRGFNLRYDAGCQNTLVDYRGVIESPNFPNSAPHNINCSWKILAPPGNKINITFSHFDLELPYSGNCSFDFLELKEGRDNQEFTKHLGTFCGQQRPPELISTELNTIYINFVTDLSVESNGFRLEWIFDGCGGIFDAPYGILKTPNYPQHYPANTDCQWTINVGWDSSVELTLQDVDIEQGPECTYDYIKIWGGPSTSSPLLGEFCATLSRTIKISSSGRSMRIHFHSDHSILSRGFIAKYRSIPSQCGGRMTANKGSIHTKNYPQNYDAHDDCSWQIEVDKNYVISLVFVDFDVYSTDTDNCTGGFVKVYDGPDERYPLLLTHCGNVNPPVIKSTTNQLYIRLQPQGGNRTTKGFYANYTLHCGARIVTNGSGELYSVDTITFTRHELPGVNCTWTIISDDPASKVTLTFTHLDTISRSMDNSTSCISDRIEVREGDDVYAPLIGTYCGHRVPPHITSQGSALTITMITLMGMMHATFVATYSVLSNACGGQLTSAEGSFATPGYPNSYPLNAECIWTISTSPGNKALLTFGMFDIDMTDDCNGDYLEVRAGLNGSDPLLGVYCGNNIPNNITALTKLWLKFRSDSEGVAAGFIAHYALVNGGELSGRSGILTNPLYPKPYTKSEVVWWRITVDFGNAIRIVFKELLLDAISCHLNSLTIYDGFDATAQILLTVCETQSLPDPIESTNSVVYVLLRNSAIRFGTLLNMEWLQVQRNVGRQVISPTASPIPGCGGIYSNFSTNSSIDFTSPGYPHGYAHNLDCEWIFEARPTNHMALIFQVINLEPSSGCRFDYVALYKAVNGPDNWNLIGTYCHPNATQIPGISASNLLKVVFHTDIYNNRSGFAATAVSVCGGYLNEPNGVIEVFNLTQPGPMFSFFHVCEYNITVRPGRKINVTFEALNLPDQLSSCSDVYILLKNGAGPDSPLLGDGKYCGNRLPPKLQTTGNKLYIKYIGMRGTYGFRLRYKEVSQSCGDQYYFTGDADFRVIASPNYPRVPPSHTECEWVFVAPQGHKIRIDFTDRLDFSYSKNCEKAYVEVHDGSSTLSPLIGRYCRESPSSISSSDNAIYVHFFTNASDPKAGFSANVTVAKCGGTIRSDSGIIEAPEIRESFRVECVWKIIAISSHLLSFTFENILLPQSANCSGNDYVAFYENININRQQETTLGRYCGSERPTEEIQSSSDQVVLKFVSSSGSGEVNQRKFKIRFTSTIQRCGGVFSTPEGEITSPGYPSIQRRRRICFWAISVPKGRRVRLEFLDFDLEGSHPVCPQWLGVYNGVQQLPLGLFCGSDNPSVLESSSNKILLQSLAWHSSGRRGFRLKYTSDEPSVCEGNINGPSGSLRFPSTNLTSIYCEWERTDVTTSSNSTFAITIVNATIKSVPDVPCEQSVQSLIINTGTRLLGKYCGNYSTPQIIANPFGPTNVIVIQGEVDSTIHFHMDYKLHECGGVVNGPVEVITSPNFPQEYSASTDCAWSLQYPPGQTIQLTFDYMDLEAECDHDYVAIYNGPTAMSPLIKTLCGNTNPTKFQSQSNAMFITFHSNSHIQRTGFKITAQPVVSGCGGIFHLKQGQITSPNFPNDYPNNAECEWEIRVDTGYHIGLVFTDRFHLEISPDCGKDFIEVFNYANDDWISLGTNCGRNLPEAYNSTGNQMKILFRSDSRITGDGFKASWTVNCGGVITEPQGVIISPSYPENYGKSLSCNYTLSAPGKVISYEFVDFSLEQGFQDCRYDNVTLYRNLGYMRQNRILPPSMIFSSTHCGQEAPPTGWSPNSLSVVFQTDKWIERRGFRMKYQFEMCGGEMNTSGVIESPKNVFIQGHDPKVNCTWVITAPLGKTISLRFENFAIESSFECHFAYLEGFEGKTVNASKSLGKLCGNLTNRFRTMKSSKQQMTVTYYSERMFRRHSHFSAVVSFTYGEAAGCGGFINATTSAVKLRSISIPPNTNYEPMLDCHWLVQALPGETIYFSVAYMNIADCNSTTNATACSCDYLEVFDGSGQFSDLIGRYCSTNMPEPITSSNNALWVRFVSDDMYNAQGFEASVTSVPSICGPSLLRVTNTTQVLQAPSYPQPYAGALRCTWHLMSNQLMRFDIHLVDLDIETSEGCGKDRLEIVDTAYSDTFNEGFGENFVYTGPYKPTGGYMFQYSPSRTAGHKSTFCGTGKPIDYYSITSNVDINFITDSGVSGRGFKLEYKFATCSRNYTRKQGRILNQWEQREAQCIMSIQTEPNRTIALYFSEMFMISANNCTSTGLEVRDGPTSTSPLLARVCGFTLPLPIFSTGPNLHLTTWSYSNWFREHYDVTYTTTDQGRGCGGEIYNVAGSVTSPLYPSNLRNYTTCTWQITVPEGSVVQIQFQVFNIGPSSTCDTDYIKIFDVNLMTGNRIFRTQLCGMDFPAAIFGTTNSVVLTYVTSVHNAGSGWTLHFAAFKRGQ